MPADVIENTAERAVRNYLVFLDDPRKLVDDDLVNSLQAKAQQAIDPIERLRIYSELERAQCADESTYRLDFILHAKTWAAANDVSTAAFRRFGVGDDVLNSAGLLPGEATGKSIRKRDSTRARTSVTAESIKSHVRSLRGTFTMADVQSKVGGSPMTVRKGVQALVDDGSIARLGPMQDWSGRGRAPIVFEVRSAPSIASSIT